MVRGEVSSVEVDDIITYLVVVCNDKTSVVASDIVMHRKGLQSTVTFSLKVRGVNIITRTFKIAKLFCREFCTGYLSTPYTQSVTRVIGV